MNSFMICEFNITMKCIKHDGIFDPDHFVRPNQCLYCYEALIKIYLNKKPQALKECRKSSSNKCYGINFDSYFVSNKNICINCYKHKTSLKK